MPKKKEFPTELYHKHLQKLKAQDKDVDIILDVTDEEANWLTEVRKEREEE